MSTRPGLLRRIAPRNGAGKRSLRRLLRFAEISPIGQSNSVCKRGACAPAQFGKTADIEQFARRTVGPRGIEADLAAVSDAHSHQAREFGNGNIFAGADI